MSIARGGIPRGGFGGIDARNGGAFLGAYRLVAADVTVAAATDYTVEVNSAAAARAVTLPNPATTQTAQVFVVKRNGANDVTITPAAGLIDGQANLVLGTDLAFAMMQSTGTGYTVIG